MREIKWPSEFFLHKSVFGICAYVCAFEIILTPANCLELSLQLLFFTTFLEVMSHFPTDERVTGVNLTKLALCLMQSGIQIPSF